MSWFPVDDAFHSHPKARRAGLEAIGLWVVSGSFCMAYLTDGFVPEWFVKEKPKGLTLAKRLVAADLWKHGDNGIETGWWFHDWKHECTKAEIEKAREKARLRKRKSREQHSDVTGDVTGDVTRDKTRDGTVSSHDCLGPTQPNPTQPINTLVALSWGVTQADAREPSQRCAKHETTTGPVPPCSGCATAREAHRAWTAERDADAQRAKADRRAAIDGCALCDDQGMSETIDGLTRCNHAAIPTAVSHA